MKRRLQRVGLVLGFWALAGCTGLHKPPAPAGMVWIPAGSFTMDSPQEGPHTRVRISQGFWMGKYEVTQDRYLVVMGKNPSLFTGDPNRPVEQVSWNDATNYCAKLTAREGNAARLPAGHKYRLPTDAEWEYACRAGTSTPFHYGKELRSGMANFNGQVEYLVGDADHLNRGGSFLQRTTSVGSYAPNEWGLYDMHGNVCEWCQDLHWGPLPGGSVRDPKRRGSASYRVIRGGSWNDYASHCRSAQRYGRNPAVGHYSVGFRVVLAPVQP